MDLGFSWDDDQSKTPAQQPTTRPPAAPGTFSGYASDQFQPASAEPYAPEGAGFGSSLTQTPPETPKSSQPSVEPSWTSLGTPSAAGTSSTGDSDLSKFQQTNAYRSTLDQITQTQDPQQRAILQDKLGRDLYASLSDAGHDVKWDGDQMIIDGRPYVIGAGTGTTNTGVNGGNPNAGAWTPPNGNTGINGGNSGVLDPQSYGAAPSGYDPAKWADPNSDSAKYIVSRDTASIRNQLLAIPDEAGRKAFMQQHLQTLVPQLQAAGWTVHDIQGEKLLISGHGDPPHWADAVTDIEGAAGVGWTVDGGQQPMASASLPLEKPPIAPGAAGVEVGAPGPENNWNGAGTAHPDAIRAGYGPQGTTPQSGFRTTAPTYTPGEIPDDTPKFSYEDILNDAGSYQFDGFGDLPGLGAGRTDGLTEDLVARILEHPESLSDHDIEMLKAKSKDELGEMQALDEDDLRHQAGAMGIDDSPFMLSQLAQSDRDRDIALTKSNRDIDLSSAATRAGDRRAAAELGSSYANSKAQRALAERSQVFSELQAGESNKQASVESRQRAVALASDTALRSAALSNDRYALRESINQKATELGQNADKLQLDYTLALIDDATRRYGLDLGATIDREKLSQAGREFQEELAFRFAQLNQQDAQFGASYGIDVGRLQRDLDNDAYSRYTDDGGE